MRLIDADALKEGKFHAIEDWTPVDRASWQWGWNDAIDAIIISAPTVDPVKHGYWCINGNRRCECSVCHAEGNLSGHDYYCRNCGAKMDGVENGKNG